MKAANDEKMSLRLPADEKAAFLAACEAEDVTPPQIIRRLIRQWVKGKK